MDILTWKKIKFQKTDHFEGTEGYLFFINGKELKFEHFQPCSSSDILWSNFFESSQASDDYEDDMPVIECCTCGMSCCDAMRAFVTYEDDTVSWIIFNSNPSYNFEENFEKKFGEYVFSRIDYEKVINQLIEFIAIDDPETTNYVIQRKKEIENRK